VAALRDYLNFTEGIPVDNETARELLTGYVIDLSRDIFRRQYGLYTGLAFEERRSSGFIAGEDDSTLVVGESPCSMKCGQGTKLVQTATCERTSPIAAAGTRTRTLDGERCRVGEFVYQDCFSIFSCHAESE